jgi:hypothetical protein
MSMLFFEQSEALSSPSCTPDESGFV